MSPCAGPVLAQQRAAWKGAGVHCVNPLILHSLTCVYLINRGFTNFVCTCVCVCACVRRRGRRVRESMRGSESVRDEWQGSLGWAVLRHFYPSTGAMGTRRRAVMLTVLRVARFPKTHHVRNKVHYYTPQSGLSEVSGAGNVPVSILSCDFYFRKSNPSETFQQLPFGVLTRD